MTGQTTNIQSQDILTEFHFEASTGRTARLSGSIPAPAKLGVLIQDKLGRMVDNQEINLEAGSFSLEIALPKLQPGVHHAWIDVQQRTFVHEFMVLQGQESGGVAGWLRSWLN